MYASFLTERLRHHPALPWQLMTNEDVVNASKLKQYYAAPRHFPFSEVTIAIIYSLLIGLITMPLWSPIGNFIFAHPKSLVLCSVTAVLGAGLYGKRIGYLRGVDEGHSWGFDHGFVTGVRIACNLSTDEVRTAMQAAYTHPPMSLSCMTW
jgi:hypothetical protein